MVMDSFEHGVTVLPVDEKDAGAGYLNLPFPIATGSSQTIRALLLSPAMRIACRCTCLTCASVYRACACGLEGTWARSGS
jgi:hypothetical protein